MTTLSPDQTAALDAIAVFLADPRPRKSYHVIHGLAGSGKTTAMSHLAQRNPNMMLTAYTGKAAAVLRKKTGLTTGTVHSAIYNFCGMSEEDEDGKRDPLFVEKGVRIEHVILVDECSMLDRRIAEDMLATGARVIACGDPGQLPPVRGEQFFIDPDSVLTQIHRQALESPIIRQAHNVRANGRYEADGDGFRVIARAEPEDLLAADAILCWRNDTRRRLNIRKRELLDISGPLRAGEPIMCLKNNHHLAIWNGEVYPLLADAEGDRLLIEGDRGVVSVEPVTVEGFDRKFDQRRYDEDWTPFAMGYSSTCHKAQGAEYPNVLLFDEYDKEDKHRRNWLYTGITRAVERCTVVKWR